MTFPDDCRYTKEHEWIRLDGDTATIGITDYAQSELGDIVFVELPEEGDHFDADDVFGTVEAVKTVSELFCPVAGTIAAANADLEDAPESVNEDAYGAGWMIKLTLDDVADFDGLMSAADYKHMIGADS
ncbi:MAG: glycine cleavage system protein GcvH [Bacteroidota bacterium]